MRLRVRKTRSVVAAAVVTFVVGAGFAPVAQGAGSLVVSTCGAFVFGQAVQSGLNTLMYSPREPTLRPE